MEAQSSARGGAGSGDSGGGGGPSDLSLEEFDPYDEDARFAVHLAANSGDGANSSAAGPSEAAAVESTRPTDTVWAWAAAAVAEADANDARAAKLTEASLAAEFDEDARFAIHAATARANPCLLYTSPSPRDGLLSRMPSSA